MVDGDKFAELDLMLTTPVQDDPVEEEQFSTVRMASDVMIPVTTILTPIIKKTSEEDDNETPVLVIDDKPMFESSPMPKQ